MQEKVSVRMEAFTGVRLEEAHKKLLDESSTYIDFPKGSTALLQGDQFKDMYFIMEGLVRAYYIDEEGNDITKSFAAENEFFATKGLMTNEFSLFNVECLEECRCIRIPYHILYRIMKENPEITRIFNQHLIVAMEELEIRTRDLVMKSAQERYRDFQEKYPKLEQRIPQKYIASFIGIQTGSLSRIRKDLKNKN